MKLLKSIGAVAAGFVFVFATSTVTDIILHATGVMPNGPLFDTPLLMLALSYRTLYTVLGCYLAAWLAPSHPMKHALILGAFGIVAGSVGAIVMSEYGPAWYAWGIVVLALPCAWVGGALVQKTR